RPKLLRIHKNRHHDHIALSPGCMHQAEVAGVQVPHGGDQAKTFARGAMCGQELAESTHGVENLHDVYVLPPTASLKPQGPGMSCAAAKHLYYKASLGTISQRRRRGMSACQRPRARVTPWHDSR